MKSKRKYSDDERALALVAVMANGGNISRTSKQLSIPRKTLAQWNSGERHPEAAKMSHLKKGAMADALEKLVWQLIESINAEKIKQASLVQLMVAIGIGIDKMVLLRRQPTPIPQQDFSQMIEDELDREIKKRRTDIEATGKENTIHSD